MNFKINDTFKDLWGKKVQNIVGIREMGWLCHGNRYYKDNISILST